MPQIKSAIKRVKTQRKAQERNISQKNAMRTAIKKFETAAQSNGEDRDALYTQAISAVDRAKSKGLIKANNAARTKSRLSKITK